MRCAWRLRAGEDGGSGLLLKVCFAVHLVVACLGVLSDVGDRFGGYEGSAVLPAAADEGGDIGNVRIGDGGVLTEAGHEGLGGEFFAIDVDGALEAVEEDFYKTVLGAGDPIRGVEGGAEVGEAFAIGSVTADAGGFSEVDFLTALVGGEVEAFEEAGGIDFLFWSIEGVFHPGVELLVLESAIIGGDEELAVMALSGDGGLANEGCFFVFGEEINEGFLGFRNGDGGEEAGLVGEDGRGLGEAAGDRGQVG